MYHKNPVWLLLIFHHTEQPDVLSRFDRLHLQCLCSLDRHRSLGFQQATAGLSPHFSPLLSKVPIVISTISSPVIFTYSVLGLAPNLLEGKEEAKSAKGCFRDFCELI